MIRDKEHEQHRTRRAVPMSHPQKVLVTGAGGLLGRHFINLIESSGGHETQFLRWDRQLHGSLLSSRKRRVALELIRPTTVVHLAWAPTSVSGYQTAPENAEWSAATQEFIEECVERGIWMIAAGSAVDACQSPDLATPYSTAKSTLRAFAESWIERDAQITWVRPQYVVSIEDARPSVVRSFLLSDAASPFKLRTPFKALDFIEVRDVATALQIIINEALVGQVYVGSGRLRTVRELLSAVSAERDGSKFVPPSAYPVNAPETPTVLRAHGWIPVHTESLFGEVRK